MHNRDLVVFIKEEIHELLTTAGNTALPFSLRIVSVSKITQLFQTLHHQPSHDFIIIIAKNLYFEFLPRFQDLFEANGYICFPVFLVVSTLFTSEEVDAILSKHNLFFVPDGQPQHLLGVIRHALAHFHNRKKESLSIVDTFRDQVDLELYKQAEAQNKALLAQISRQSALLESMYQFSNILNSQGTLEKTLESIVKMLSDFTKCRRISIMLMDTDQQHLSIKKALGIPRDIVHSTYLKSAEGLAGKVFEEGKILVINERESAAASGLGVDLDTILGLPVMIIPLNEHETKLGVINLTDRPENQPFNADDVDVLSSLSHAAAIAINNQVNKLKLKEAFLGMTKALVRTIEAKDPYTRGHSDRVVALCMGIAEKLELSEEQTEALRFGAILHDIGKIGVPGRILNYSSKLNGDQSEKSREHPRIGEWILKDIPDFAEIRHIILYHHEHVDGSGYPDGLKGEAIPLEARVIAVADAFDAMRYDRPYRKALPLPKVLKELKRVRGKQLDKRCVDALLEYLKESEDAYQ